MIQNNLRCNLALKKGSQKGEELGLGFVGILPSRPVHDRSDWNSIRVALVETKQGSNSLHEIAARRREARRRRPSRKEKKGPMFLILLLEIFICKIARCVLLRRSSIVVGAA